MLSEGLSLLPIAAILAVVCHILQHMTMTHVSGINESKPKKVFCFFAAMLVLAAVCLLIAAAFDEVAVIPPTPEDIEQAAGASAIYLLRRFAWCAGEAPSPAACSLSIT